MQLFSWPNQPEKEYYPDPKKILTHNAAFIGLKSGYLIASHRNFNFQVAIDAASIPKDAKIAVLEKSSTESEKKIAGKSLPVPTVSVMDHIDADPDPTYHFDTDLDFYLICIWIFI